MKRKIMVVCPAGGHLCEARIALEQFGENETLFVTNPLPHLKNNPSVNMFFIIDPHVSFLKYILNFLSALKLFFKMRPQIVLSTGGGISISLFILGKIFGSTTVFIESGSRILFPSKTGRLLYPFSDYFFIQSEHLLKFYPKAVQTGIL